MNSTETKIESICYHCGDDCKNQSIRFKELNFCCQGCLSVYQLLNSKDMDEYYCLNETPGQKIESLPKEKFAFLDEASIVQQLLLFRNKAQAQVSFYLPQMHCSSCLWLLEHLSEINENIITSQVNFSTKTLKVTFKIEELSLRQLAELLAHIGYEPVIDMNEEKADADKYNAKRAYLKLGVTGFCFANIMMIAFPEYLGLDPAEQPNLALAFKMVSVLLSIPVVFYGASEFFVNAFYSFRQRYLNIDAPIALAIAVTWLRSLYEVFTHTGAGFFDSMTGIVFFMLLGRTIQNRSRTTLKFNRDYKSYFPITVTGIRNGVKSLIKLEDIEQHDQLLIHHQEVIPTDCLLSKGEAKIDYSFVTGESKPEILEKSEVIYAGGRNVGETIEVVSVKAFNQNSFTQLWNSSSFRKTTNDDKESRVTLISKYFSIVVLLLSVVAFVFWKFQGNSDIAWKSATAVLIIACPCALLLTASFTNGYMMERFASAGVYLKNSNIIERLAGIDSIVFDKTGTLTEPSISNLELGYSYLNDDELSKVLFLASQSIHPLSRSLTEYYSEFPLQKYKAEILELPGKGLQAVIEGSEYRIGNAEFTGANPKESKNRTVVYISVDAVVKARFNFNIGLMEGTNKLLNKLVESYELSLISGDNAVAGHQLEGMFGGKDKLHFNMTPGDKLDFVRQKQSSKHKVMMIGDGLNDAGALKQSDVGVSVVKSAFAFSPSCDVIMDVSKLKFLPNFMKWAKGAGTMINIGFAYSLIFNFIGLAFALTGKLSPLVAAIIMPMSSLGIIFIAWIGVRTITNQK